MYRGTVPAPFRAPQRGRQLGALGFDPFAAIASGFGIPTPGGASPTESMPGFGPTGPRGGGGSNVNVSPAIQTTVSPVISPTFTQVQDAPGARVSAATSAQQAGSQAADTRAAQSGAPGGGPLSPAVMPGGELFPAWDGGTDWVTGRPSVTTRVTEPAFFSAPTPAERMTTEFFRTDSRGGIGGVSWPVIIGGVLLVGLVAVIATQSRRRRSR